MDEIISEWLLWQNGRGFSNFSIPYFFNMVSIQRFMDLAASLAEGAPTPHFEKLAYRSNKKIFVTLSEAEARACLRLSAEDQSVFCAIDPDMIYPVPNKWGTQGWTIIELRHVTVSILRDALGRAQGFANIKSSGSKKRLKNGLF